MIKNQCHICTMLRRLLATATARVRLLSHAQLVARDTDTQRSALMDSTLPGVLIHGENDHLAAAGLRAERRGGNEQMHARGGVAWFTHTLLLPATAAALISPSPSTRSTPPALLYCDPPPRPTLSSSHLCHCLPPPSHLLPLLPFLHPSALHRSALSALSPSLKNNAPLGILVFTVFIH